MKVRPLILLLVFLLPVLLLAQPGAKKYSLDECIKMALESNYTLNLGKIQNKISRKDYLQSYSGILPTLDFRYSGSKYEQGPSSYLGGEYVGNNNPFRNNIITGRNYYSSFQVGQNIFDGGRWYLNIKKKKYDKKQSTHTYYSTRQNVIVTVRQLYMDLLKQQRLLAVKKETVDRSAEQLEKVKSMFEVGSVAQVDVFRSEVNLGNDKISYLNQQNITRTAQRNLNIAMGRQPEVALQIDDQVTFEKDLRNLPEFISKALERNPDIQAQYFRMKSSKLDLRMAQSRFLPNLSAFYQYERRVPKFAGLRREFDRDYSWYVGLSLNWNLFNGFSDLLDVQKAALNKKYQQEQLKYDRLNLQSKVTNLYDNLKALNQIIEINKTNLSSAREDYRLAEESYRLGSGTLLDVRDAQVNLSNAEQILVAAEFDSYITYAELQEAAGELLDY